MISEAGSRRRRFGLFVLGMHRSGTSVAARLVNLLGLSLGSEDELLPPTDDNPTGFWENQPLLAANDELLGALGGEWRAPPHLEDGWQLRPELEGLRESSLETLRRVFQARETWAWKDPRNCLTLPFWLTLADDATGVVLVYRNPLEVAASLGSRDGTTLQLGLALWERYTRSAFAATRGLPVHVVGYERLVADPAGWCAEVSDFLSGCGAATSPVPSEALRSFVRPDLRHSTASENDLAPAQLELYTSLEGCEGSHQAFTPPDLPPESPWLQALFDEHGRYLQLQRQAERELADVQAARRATEAALASIETSRAWRMTAPIRRVAAVFMRAGRPRRADAGE